MRKKHLQFNLEFCPRLKSMIETGKSELPNGDWLPISGTSTLNNLQVIRHYLLTEKPKATLEIGLAFGASALTFLSSLKEAHGEGFHHTAIDPFQKIWKFTAVYNIAQLGLADSFTLLEQDSAIALPSLCDNGAKFGMIYVDGSHIFEDVFIDFIFGVRLLATNGIILFDDCTDPHVKKVIRFIDTNYSKILTREDTSTAISKPLWKKLGNALGRQQLVVYRKIGDPPRKWDVEFSRF